MSSKGTTGEKGKQLSASQELLDFTGKATIDSLLIKKSMPRKVGPSSVLSRVKGFLPHLEQANRELDKKIAEGTAAEVDIENVDDCEGPIIEMNLALFQHGLSSDEEEEWESGDGSKSDTDSDEEAEKKQDTGNFGEISTDTLRLPGHGTKRKSERALIEEVTEDSDERNRLDS